MKYLFKGHHPWLLVLVIAVDIFFSTDHPPLYFIKRRIRVQC